MGDLWFQLLAHSDADRARLTSEITTKMVAEDIIGYETMLTVTPDDVELHDDVAVLYLGMGKPLDAVRHFRASVARRLAAAPAHYNLGTALTMAGQIDEGVRELERAVELDPQYGVAYGNLGSVLLQQGRIPQAIARLEKAVALSPANVEALNSLSAAYAVAGDTARALDAIDKALRLAPTAPMQRVLRQRRDLLTRQR
jgi:tetratricopeptide (TPR) repeat protein